MAADIAGDRVLRPYAPLGVKYLGEGASLAEGRHQQYRAMNKAALKKSARQDKRKYIDNSVNKKKQWR